MITLAEVIEQCAQVAEAIEPQYDDHRISELIRALAAQYEGCIVAEGDCVMSIPTLRGDLPLYRAREMK